MLSIHVCMDWFEAKEWEPRAVYIEANDHESRLID